MKTVRRFVYNGLIFFFFEKIYEILCKISNFFFGLIGVLFFFGLFAGIPALFIAWTGVLKPLENSNSVFIIVEIYFVFFVFKNFDIQKSQIENLLKSQKELKWQLEKQVLESELANWRRSKATE